MRHKPICDFGSEPNRISFQWILISLCHKRQSLCQKKKRKKIKIKINEMFITKRESNSSKWKKIKKSDKERIEGSNLWSTGL